MNLFYFCLLFSQRESNNSDTITGPEIQIDEKFEEIEMSRAFVLFRILILLQRQILAVVRNPGN